MASQNSPSGAQAVETLDANSDAFEDVVKLADQNSKFLGFFPKQAFKRSADDGKILVIYDIPKKSIKGYLLYFVAHDRAKIQHLCVKYEFRKEGIGRILVDDLKTRTKHLEAITLHCARKFPAHEFWPRVGFVAVGEKLGRGKDKKWLTNYRFDHGHPNLFTVTTQDVAEAVIEMVIDANIFFAICGLAETCDNDVQALQADWIQEEVSFRVTDELFNEIARCDDDDRRERARGMVRSFPQVDADPIKRQQAVKTIAQVLGTPTKVSDVSDQAHLANAIAGNFEHFVTHDSALLARCRDVHADLGIRVIQPIELITMLDELRRDVEYAPARLAGASPTVQRVGSELIPTVLQRFLNTGRGEKKGAFCKRLSALLSDPENVTAETVSVGKGDPIVLIVSREPASNPNVWTVPVLRSAKHQLSPTILRHIVHRAVRQSAATGDGVCTVTDNAMDPRTENVLRDLGFRRSGDGWTKLNLSGCCKVDEIRGRLSGLLESVGFSDEFKNKMLGLTPEAESAGHSAESLAQLEQFLWPMRIVDDRIPNYIVPIQPRWARELFDERLASEQLIPADEDIALRCENVYYRSGHIQIPPAPAHVLWYVSAASDSIKGPQSIRACSNIVETTVGTPKELFVRFKRLGVYRWQDVLGVAKNEHNRSILAFRFCGTQIFPNEVRFEEVKEVLMKAGQKMPPLSMPVKIPATCFEELFNSGSGGK
jgi:GNAT superfamily N-acetyltransferase/predicted nucleic acid-binding protein